jgi:hypothetical protein
MLNLLWVIAIIILIFGLLGLVLHFIAAGPFLYILLVREENRSSSEL